MRWLRQNAVVLALFLVIVGGLLSNEHRLTIIEQNQVRMHSDLRRVARALKVNLDDPDGDPTSPHSR